VIAFSCTVVSTTTRSRSLVWIVPLRCAIERLSCNSESPTLVKMTNEILLHVRGYRQMTIGRTERIAASLPEHLAIIEALEQRDTELAEKLARESHAGPCRLCRSAWPRTRLNSQCLNSLRSGSRMRLR
jgi:hypothetical protein